MKRPIPYIILCVVVIAAAVLLFTGVDDAKKTFNERITLRKRDKIPYGAYIAYQSLGYLFPHATISTSRQDPANWDSLSIYGSDQALIVISPRFYADDYEMKKIIDFVSNGNDVFVSAMVLAEDVKNMLKCSVSYFDLSDIFSGNINKEDTLAVSLSRPPFVPSYNFTYPGQRFDSHFFKLDTSTTTVLGIGHGGNPNFIHLKAGKGNLYVHLAPMVFSNYFLLHRDNRVYYENVLSVISPSVKKVVWDEYYIDKRYFFEPDERNKSKGWFGALMSYGPLKWALLTALITLVLYVLFEMRRKQRYIPVMGKPRNDSLDFVRTIGRLYFDKGDHRNLARKMAAYFLEHVRNRYKLPTASLDDEWVRKLQFKTGYSEEEIKDIVSFIKYLDNSETVSHKQLADFHKQLETFYQKA